MSEQEETQNVPEEENTKAYSEENLKIVEPQPPLPDHEIESFSDEIRKVIEDNKWPRLMMVQRKAIPYLLDGQDLIVQSKTGSGKTGAFVLPLMQIVEKEYRVPQALIMVPTRELAHQVHQETKRFGDPLGISSVAVYGGVGYNEQKDAFRRGVHIVVGTPGRILDHILQGTFKLDNIRDLVLDEADEMLSMGFYPDMKRIHRSLPKDRCTYLFSATMPANVRRLADEFQRRPKFLSLCPTEVAVSNMEHFYYVCDPMEKVNLLQRIIELENPESALIFCNTRRDTNFVYETLKARDFRVGILSGDINQKQRQSMLGDLRSGRINLLAATDVAARGIDIRSITHVFMYDHPDESETYVHRAGRTARAGDYGLAISLVSHIEEIHLKRTAAQFEIELTKKEMPDEEHVASVVHERALVYLEQGFRTLKQAEMAGSKRMVPLLDRLVSQEDYRTVLGMLLHEYYWERFVDKTVEKGGSDARSASRPIPES